MRYKLQDNARAMFEYANILQNSIEVNRKDGRGNDDILFSRVMIGTVGMEDRNGTIEYYAVRSVIEERINQDPVLVSFDILGNLHAANAKKVDPINHRGVKQITAPSGTMVVYQYSIPHFLKDVKGVFDDTFSKDVYKDTRYEISLRQQPFYILYLVSAELARRVSCICSINPYLKNSQKNFQFPVMNAVFLRDSR